MRARPPSPAIAATSAAEIIIDVTDHLERTLLLIVAATRYRVLLRGRQRGQRGRLDVLTTVVIRRCGLNRHHPRDAVRRESNAGRTNRPLCCGFGCEPIDVPDQWRLEIGRERLVLNKAATDVSSTFSKMEQLFETRPDLRDKVLNESTRGWWKVTRSGVDIPSSAIERFIAAAPADVGWLTSALSDEQRRWFVA